MTKERQLRTKERQLHEAEREIGELFRKFGPYNGVNDGGRPRGIEAEAAGSPLELLRENDSDAYPKLDTRAHQNNGREAQAAVNYSRASVRPSKRALGTSGVIFTIGRIAIVITFSMSALFRLVDADAIATIIASKLLPLPGPLADAAASIEATVRLPFATALVIAGATLESAAAVLIAMGILIRPASIVLLIFTAIGIYGSQWDFQNGVRPDQIISALNELSIMGGLLILFSRVRRRTLLG